MTALEEYIHGYFGVVDSRELQTIGALFHPEKINKGDFFLKTGKACDKLSFIHNGLLRIYVDNGDKEVTQWISTTGYFVTDLSSFVFGQPARWNIQALEESHLYTIHKKDYLDLGNLVPKWHELEKLFLIKCFAMLEDRIFNHLSLSAEERYLEFFLKNKTLFNQVPLQYIASMLGMSPETLSRIRKKHS